MLGSFMQRSSVVGGCRGTPGSRMRGLGDLEYYLISLTQIFSSNGKNANLVHRMIVRTIYGVQPSGGEHRGDTHTPLHPQLRSLHHQLMFVEHL